MADRYQDRPFPPGHYDRRDLNTPAAADSDPLAELARLIGQTDPFGTIEQPNQTSQPHVGARDEYEPDPYEISADGSATPAGPPPWVQRAARQESFRDQSSRDQSFRDQSLRDHFPSAEHPLRRYAAPQAAEPSYDETQRFIAGEQQPDPSRYDEALYGPLDSGEQDPRYDQSDSEDPYAYPEGYEEAAEDEPQTRRGGKTTVLVVLALAVVGTAAAFAYRNYFGAPRTGEPPIIRADNSPTKIVPSPSNTTSKMLDRLGTEDGTEKIVPREEAPLDVSPKAPPRVVFPPLNQNVNPPAAANTGSAGAPPAGSGSGTLPNLDARRVKTLPVRGDQPDPSAAPAVPAATPAPRSVSAPKTAMAGSSASANANASAPLSLAPSSEPAHVPPATRVAATNPAQTAPAASGGYLVQVSAQLTEGEAQASYRALQGKFPAVLGSRPPVIKRADLGEKGIRYRALVGPFGSSDEASQFCSTLKSAGGQCFVQRN